MRLVLGILAASMLISTGCEKKKDKATATAKMRSSGMEPGLLQVEPTEGAGLVAGILANSDVEITSLKVPITRINLVSDLKGTGYNKTSPNFYTCSGATSDDCLVELTNSDLDNLLSNTGTGEITVDSDQTYDGAAVEFCPDGAGGEGNSYNIKITASVTLGGTLYYTNAASGLSTTGPAEETTIVAGCHGFTTPLPQAVTLGPDKAVNLVLWADPNGMISGTTDKQQINADCTGEQTAAICAGFTSIFVTVDDAKPTIERFRFDVTTTSTDGPYASMLMTVLFNSSDAPIGATLQQVFQNRAEARSMHNPFYSFSRLEKNSDGTLTFKYYADSTTLGDFLANFPRSSKEGMTLSVLVSEEMEINSTKL